MAARPTSDAAPLAAVLWTCSSSRQLLCYYLLRNHTQDHYYHHLRLAPLRVRSATGRQRLQGGRFWARSTASVHYSPWESRAFCTIFVQVIRGRPGGLFQYTEGEEVKICLASTLSSFRAICPNRVRRHASIISVSRGWLVWRRTSSLEMK